MKTNKKELLLSLGTEGGCIEIFLDNGYFGRSVNESALLDMLSEEDQQEIREMMTNRPPSQKFTTFEDAFENLAAAYSVFNLIPVFIAHNYQESVRQYFERAKNDPLYFESNKNSYWNALLNGKHE